MDAEKWQEEVGTIEFKTPADALKAKDLFDRIQQKAQEHEKQAVAQVVAEMKEQVIELIRRSPALTKYYDYAPVIHAFDLLKDTIRALQPDPGWLMEHDKQILVPVMEVMAEMREVLEELAVDSGGFCHDEGCLQDDTCSCSAKPKNEKLSDSYWYSRLPGQSWLKEHENTAIKIVVEACYNEAQLAEPSPRLEYLTDLKQRLLRLASMPVEDLPNPNFLELERLRARLDEIRSIDHPSRSDCMQDNCSHCDREKDLERHIAEKEGNRNEKPINN